MIATLQRRDAWRVIDTVNRVADPSTLADLAGYAPWLSDERKRELLETPDVVERLTMLIEWTKAYIAETEVNEKIADDVRGDGEEPARVPAASAAECDRKELGEDEPDGAEDYRAVLRRPTCQRCCARPHCVRLPLERASDQSLSLAGSAPGCTVLELPWNTKTTDSTDINAAREVLDADHHGLERQGSDRGVPIRARRAERGLEVVGGRGSGACGAGEPAWRGQDLARESVARALGRNFVRVSLGGVRDEG